MCPEIGTAAIGGNGQIMVEPDRQALRFRVALGFVQLLFEYELDVFVVFDEPGMLGSECLTRFGVRRAKLLGPLQPCPAIAVLLVKSFIQGAIERKLMKQVPFPLAILLKGARAIAVLRCARGEIPDTALSKSASSTGPHRCKQHTETHAVLGVCPVLLGN